MAEARARRRLHIGNISTRLAETPDSLRDRLARFGALASPLQLHTKPVNDFHFAYVDMDLSDKELDKLKSSFNGTVYMGRKLTVSLARPLYHAAWEADAGRLGRGPADVAKHAGIAAERAQRIAEAHALAPCNSLTGAPLVKTAPIGANNASLGYSISAHTPNDASGHTKNSKPTKALVGFKSYGSTLTGRGSSRQEYSRTSGFGAVVPGRMRKTARPAAHFARKEQTMRILINGELKQIKCHKTKLWGVEKKTARDLTYSYGDGEWRLGDNHVVERVARANLALAAVVSQLPPADGDSEAAEQSKNAAVLAKLFQTHNFDGHVDLDEEEDDDAVTLDSKGRRNVARFDFEAEGRMAVDESDAEAEEPMLEVVELYKSTHERPQEEVYYSESDEGNDMDMDQLQETLTTEAIKQTYDQDHEASKTGSEKEERLGLENSRSEEEENFRSEEEENTRSGEGEQQENNEDSDSDAHSDSSEDLMPTFAPLKETKPAVEKSATTEKLRSVFNQELLLSAGLFALAEDDINEELEEQEKDRALLLEQIKQKQQKEQEYIAPRIIQQKKHGLFWSHFESPFLQTQTQLSRIGYVDEAVRLPGEDDLEAAPKGEDEKNAYETWFWSMRGEASREGRRRKKELQRRMQKKAPKAYL